MLSRTSIVDQFHVDTLIIGSVIEIGDSTFIQGFSRALAVHREVDTFFGNEGNFASYRAYTKPIPFPLIDEAITMQTVNLSPAIKVNSININGVSASSVVHIGSSQHIAMEARIKHIRQLQSRNFPEGQSEETQIYE
ncbi:spore germination protein GerPE [Cytobacillus depressus]|uniref:Spore germination protein GerPE n=1 Tax=Cytobacillus depressus TaxID=1602942 RepID=A0A6L3V6T7_9BACI|nr:spore germination protein GerPE [Cytobacillus depressus]KAB2337167.1 spore germination protein GerPE [Cytobacillus depressus]